MLVRHWLDLDVRWKHLRALKSCVIALHIHVH